MFSDDDDIKWRSDDTPTETAPMPTYDNPNLD